MFKYMLVEATGRETDMPVFQTALTLARVQAAHIAFLHVHNALASPDGLPGDEGTFNICTFWLVEALTRAGRDDPSRVEEARFMFEGMLGFANHLGLFAEEISMTGEARGNFPQALTHLALISAAFNLDLALGV